ncbi:hypothetical protein ILYODFUR_035355, partial [Ilyodon furcidens]
FCWSRHQGREEVQVRLDRQGSCGLVIQRRGYTFLGLAGSRKLKDTLGWRSTVRWLQLIVNLGSEHRMGRVLVFGVLSSLRKKESKASVRNKMIFSCVAAPACHTLQQEVRERDHTHAQYKPALSSVA